MLIGSCKKEKVEEIRPKTAADFEKVMATDKDFNQFISASIDLENLELSNYDPSSVRAFNKKRTILTNKEIDELKSIKSYDLLFDFFKVHKIDNAEERIKNLKKQSNSFYSFLKKISRI